ncbi:carbohydrate ABC transporter permease [Tepidanaerobacter syntrophicus]|uniref:Raffinose/stachyose/melibiose transport system permease protein n=1 Tax=Tepidanaerobacter syntrophicus TaxID=224999 RepID=A0A0U9HE52_9FIRM|nr:sugar ABC transporter permease [Tepidanaerobacter syntrophicus]GAQ24411.1 raffinose/stachyose/melibiose transport system permease protein [Tepidanaerobacter syntrophicus]GLI18297.1 putative ABC transporter permease protein YurN [Tepidanaerobacter syntrophicus]
MKQLKKQITPYLFMLPCFILLFVFIFLPLIQNFIYSLYDFAAFSPTKTFVGLANFKALLKDKVVVTGLTNNVRYAIISVICQVFGGLILAAILEDKLFRRIAPFFRVVYFMPVVISISVICLLFSFIYHPQIGLLNNFLKLIGLGHLAKPWLGLSKTAPYAVIAVSQWQSIGYIMMLFIVAIQKIPQELYEAAEIDGASKIRRFFSITVPQVKETIFVTTLITITGSMLVFNEPYILTKGGGPGTSSITLAVHMYLSGFFKDKMGYASTIAIVIFVITALLAVIQFKLFGGGEED